MKADSTKRQQSASFTIDLLRPHEKKSFSTDPVELNKSNLVGHWHYESGAKPNAQGSLVGGFGGTGVGTGRAKHVEPAATTDFILATIAEEFGFFGVLLVLVVIGGIVGRLAGTAFSIRSAFATDALQFTHGHASMSPRRLKELEAVKLRL